MKSLKIGKLNLPHFNCQDQEYGIQGVGKNHIPIVNMDPFINHDMDDELHIEMCKGLVLSKNIDSGKYNAPIYEQLVNTLNSLHTIDNGDVHIKAIEEIVDNVDSKLLYSSISQYCQYALGCTVPWFFNLYLKQSNFNNKTNTNDSWAEDIKYFPKLKEYVLTLPFKHIGRIKVFATFPNAGVIIHRDSQVAKHKDHSINLFFSGSRPTFIYDEVKKEKVYLEKGAKSYFFNNRDYHGVDPEPVFRYTVRVDGTFNDDMIDILQLENGYV